jgi:hypothetical protein
MPGRGPKVFPKSPDFTKVHFRLPGIRRSRARNCIDYRGPGLSAAFAHVRPRHPPPGIGTVPVVTHVISSWIPPRDHRRHSFRCVPKMMIQFTALFRRLVSRDLAIGRRRMGLNDTVPKRRLPYRNRHDVPIGPMGQKSHGRGLANRACLFKFIARRDAPPTDKVSESRLRPGVILRKVTNGLRGEWGTEIYAGFRFVISTAKAGPDSVCDAMRFAPSAKRPATAVAGTG